MRAWPRSWKVSLVTSLLWCAALLAPPPSHAVPASPHPVKARQPDGTVVELYIRGDEFVHFYEDQQGYTVVRRGTPAGRGQRGEAGARAAAAGNEDGWYTYATIGQDGQLVPTALKVGVDPPEGAGLSRQIRPRESVAMPRMMLRARATEANRVRPQGDVPNLVILMRFANHSARTVPPPGDYDVVFNKPGGDPQLAPTGSVRDVYLQNSYNTMRLNSKVVGWVDLPQTEAYYADGDSGLTNRFAEAIQAALNKADAQVNFKDFDRDNDGRMDAIAFIHSGYGAEWGGEDADGVDFKDRIWSHQFHIPTWTSQEGVRVSDYHVSTGFWDTQGSEPTHIGVVAHETGHFFGLPDLYDYSDFGSGLGAWSIMANSWGFDGSQQHPPHFDAWSKVQLGWVAPTLLSAAGTYKAPAVETTPTIYKIAAGYNSATEYLLIENRQPTGYDDQMPSGPGGNGGLAIWHVDETKPRNDEPGYPGQSGWPQNNKHYKVALLQADGRFHLERSSLLSPADRRAHGNGDGTDLFRAGNVTRIGYSTTPNTNGYQGGTVRRPGHWVYNISATGPSMTFRYARLPIGQQPAPGSEIASGGASGNGSGGSAQVTVRESTDAQGVLRINIQLDRPLDIQIDVTTKRDTATTPGPDSTADAEGPGEEGDTTPPDGSEAGAAAYPRGGSEPRSTGGNSPRGPARPVSQGRHE